MTKRQTKILGLLNNEGAYVLAGKTEDLPRVLGIGDPVVFSWSTFDALKRADAIRFRRGCVESMEYVLDTDYQIIAAGGR